MSTIIDRINSINQGVQDVKADFKTALENKGVEVADTLKLKDYPPLIEDIQSGGGRGIGKYIGEIFAYPSALPPAGAFLLNGQTIPNCQETYKEFWNWLNDGVTNNYIRTLTNSAYEAEITEYGMCDAFAISGSDVRLPKWNGYQTPLGNSVPVIGNGLTMGLTDGANTYGLRMYKPGISARSDSIPGETLVGAHIGGGGTMLRDEYAVGLSTDPTKSGIIADTSGLYPDRWSWVIQVFNTATDLSNQESAQLASQMQMKAQKDLGNVDNNIDFVVDSYDDGQGNWYRVYKSGWCEQGGRFSIASTKTITITLLKPYLTNKYSVQCQSIFPDAFENMYEDSGINIQSEPTNSTIIFESTYGNKTGIWEAKGYIA